MSEETKLPTPPPPENKIPENPPPASGNDGVDERSANPSSHQENHKTVAVATPKTAPKNDGVTFLSRGAGSSLKK